MMRAVHLYGPLATRYGALHRFDIETAPEAVRALSANFKDFARDIGEGNWHVVVGKTPEEGMDLSIEEMDGLRLGANDVHILPAIEGAKNRGAVKLILGVALLGLSFGFGGAAMAGMMSSTVAAPIFGAGFTFGNLAGTIGLSMALTGASTLLAPKEEKPKTWDSFVMTGPTNTADENSIVPIAYGNVIGGGVIIAAGIDVIQIQSQQDAADDGGVLDDLLNDA